MFSTMRVGVRREDKNEWERRVPVTPDHVRNLTAQGLQVFVQPSSIRIFQRRRIPRRRSHGAGRSLRAVTRSFAVKEIPADFFRDGGAYMFFSHTFKGQPYNMPMLRTLIKRDATLIDYEKVVDDQNRRS